MEFATKFKPHKDKGITFVKPSLCQQHFKDECDINTIIAHFQETGQTYQPAPNRQDANRIK